MKFTKIFFTVFVIFNLAGCALFNTSPSEPQPEESAKPIARPVSLEELIPESDYYYVVSTDKGVVIRADAANTFKVGKAEVLPQSSDYLDEIATILKKSVPANKSVLIAGHTDRSGSKAANDRLSLRRAQSVMAELVRRGVNPARLKAEGFGFDEPIADNTSEDGRAMNRRVEIIVLNEVAKGQCLCPAFQ